MKRIKSVFYDSCGATTLGIAVFFVGVLAVLFGVIGTLCYHVDSASCSRYGERQDRATVYDFWGEGCYVETNDGTFIPTANFRVTNEEGDR